MVSPVRRRDVFLLSFIGIMGLLYAFILQSDGTLKFISSLTSTSQGKTFAVLPNAGIPGAIGEEQLRRIQRITDNCAWISHSMDGTFTYKVQSNVYFYEKFNLSYCKVPKISSTFMVEMFQTLITGHVDDKTIFHKARGASHALTMKHRVKNKTSSYPTVITSRNPYTRLFSAYVDKMILPNMYKLAQKIKRQNIADDTVVEEVIVNNKTVICANDITFQQFLDDVIQTAKANRSLNVHWAPISSICRPCLTDNYMIIKHESFVEDIEHFLYSLPITMKTFDDIKTIMTSKRIESTLPGIIRVVLSRTKRLLHCLSYSQALENMWQAFQIQGYIHEDREFPIGKLNHIAGAKSVEYISKVMVRQAKLSNLNKEESKNQRNRYLSRAYRGISAETIAELKKLYMHDFILFGYSMEPPL